MSPAWDELDRRDRGTRFIAIESKSIVNSSAVTHMRFATINPFIGCEFGCAYCYARDTHRWTVERAVKHGQAVTAREAEMLPPAEAFERRILVKVNAAALLSKRLARSRLQDEWVMIGSATDPYQPAEREFGVTRSLLKALLPYRGIKIGVITKSPLIARDTELLAALSARHRVTVSLSLASTDAALLRLIEPRTPAPHARLRAMSKLTRAGVRVGLLIAPILPGITDGYTALLTLIEAAKAAGAAWVAGSPLRMGPATRATLIPWLARERPELRRRYERHYGNRMGVSRAYNDGLQARLKAIQVKIGIEPGTGLRMHRELSEAGSREELQLRLWAEETKEEVKGER